MISDWNRMKMTRIILSLFTVFLLVLFVYCLLKSSKTCTVDDINLWNHWNYSRYRLKSGTHWNHSSRAWMVPRFEFWIYYWLSIVHDFKMNSTLKKICWINKIGSDYWSIAHMLLMEHFRYVHNWINYFTAWKKKQKNKMYSFTNKI